MSTLSEKIWFPLMLLSTFLQHVNISKPCCITFCFQIVLFVRHEKYCGGFYWMNFILISVLGVLAVVYCVVLVTVKYFVVGKDRDADIKTRLVLSYHHPSNTQIPHKPYVILNSGTAVIDPFQKRKENWKKTHYLSWVKRSVIWPNGEALWLALDHHDS